MPSSSAIHESRGTLHMKGSQLSVLVEDSGSANSSEALHYESLPVLAQTSKNTAVTSAIKLYRFFTTHAIPLWNSAGAWYERRPAASLQARERRHQLAQAGNRRRFDALVGVRTGHFTVCGGMAERADRLRVPKRAKVASG